MRRLFPFLMAFMLLLPSARGEQGNADDNGWRRQARTAHFSFFAPDARKKLARQLSTSAERRYSTLCEQLGLCDYGPDHIDVYLAEDAERFASSFPTESAMAEWAVGVAFTAENRIVLRAHGSALFSVVETFEHEVSHLLLYAQISRRNIPRWFSEGLAIWQSGESVIKRLEAAHHAALTGRLQPLRKFTKRFPSRGQAVSLAYAQSGLFLRWLVSEYSPDHLRALVRRLAAGSAFRSSFQTTYGTDIETLDSRWREALTDQSSLIALLRDHTLLWVLMAFLFLFASATQFWRKRQRLAAMVEEEDSIDAWQEVEADRDRGQGPTLH